MIESKAGPCPHCGTTESQDSYQVGERYLRRWLCGSEEHISGHVMCSAKCYEVQIAKLNLEVKWLLAADKADQYELKRLNQDARRYRFIRKHYAIQNGMGWFLSSGYVGGAGAEIRDGKFDDAVDRAIAILAPVSKAEV